MENNNNNNGKFCTRKKGYFICKKKPEKPWSITMEKFMAKEKQSSVITQKDYEIHKYV